MTELRECPFCGGKATGYPNSWAVKCESCNIQRYGLSYADAIERWNTRYERTAEKVPGKMKFGTRLPKCSECGQSLGDSRWSYCPNCGARVVEGDAS